MSGNILISTFQKIRSRLREKAIDITGTPEDADDALQEAFCNLWQRRDTINTRGAAEGMSTVAVRNESINVSRRKSKNTYIAHDNEVVSVSNDTQEQADRECLFESVKALIDSILSERDRSILYKREMYGYTFEELAEEYGTTENNVRMIVSRARKNIREIYRTRKL